MVLGTPTVEMVMCLAPILMSSFRALNAATTDGRFSSGSPMPMKTMLETRSLNCS